MQHKLSIASSCQSIQIVHHLVSQVARQAHSDKFGMSVPKQIQKNTIIDLLSIITLTLEPNCKCKLTCTVLEDEHFPTKPCLKDPEQRVAHQAMIEEWHSYNMYSPSLKSCQKKILKYVWNIYCIMTNYERDYVSFPYPVNATSFSNGCFSRDLKEIWLANRDVWVIGRGGGIRPGPDVLLVDFLQI